MLFNETSVQQRGAWQEQLVQKGIFPHAGVKPGAESPDRA